MSDMIKTLEDHKDDQDVVRSFGRGCACGCRPDVAEGGYHAMGEHNGCGCPEPDIPANVS